MVNDSHNLAILEGLLFLKGDAGASIREITEALNMKAHDASKVINRLNELYTNSADRGLIIKRYAKHYRLVTKEQYYEIYKQVLAVKNYLQLSKASYETLAIIAYNGPITKVEIENLRGVNCDSVIHNLMFKNLIQSKGKSDLPGRPQLYAVSQYFMQYFNLNSLQELPELSKRATAADENSEDIYENR